MCNRWLLLGQINNINIIDKILPLHSSPGCCGSVTLSATGAAAEKNEKYLGRYEALGEEHQGAPVYRNSNERLLYRYSDGSWLAGIPDGRGGWCNIIKSVDTAACPDRVSQWQYYHDVALVPGDITVNCSA